MLFSPLLVPCGFLSLCGSWKVLDYLPKLRVKGMRVKNSLKPCLWLSFGTTNNLKQPSPSLSPLLAALESSNSVLPELE